MKNFNLPTKLIEEFKRTGILAIGEIHGIKENYNFYNSLLNNLPFKPNLAIEMTSIEKIEFEKYLSGEEVDSSKLSSDGRLNVEYFAFLKNYIKENSNVKIIYFDIKEENLENLKNKQKTRDEIMANNLLNELEKPVVIIAGNIHTEKKMFDTGDNKIYPMGLFLKQKLGDFPVVQILYSFGNYFNFTIREFKTKEVLLNEFIEKEDCEYIFYQEKATPTNPL